MKLATATLCLSAIIAGATPAAEPVRATAVPAPPAPPAPPSAGVDETPPWLGIVFGDALDGGVQVVAVVPGGPADTAGVSEGDVLLTLGERATPDRAALQEVVRELRPGQPVGVRLIRGGRIAEITLRPVDARRREFPLFDLRAPESPRAASRAGPERAPLAGFETARVPRELRVHLGAPAEAGVLVVRVDGEGPAAKAGILVGDVLVRIADRPVEEPIDLARALAREAGKPVAVRVVRGRKTVALQIEAPGAAPTFRADELRRLAVEQRRLRRELERVEAQIEELRRLER